MGPMNPSYGSDVIWFVAKQRLDSLDFESKAHVTEYFQATSVLGRPLTLTRMTSLLPPCLGPAEMTSQLSVYSADFKIWGIRST